MPKLTIVIPLYERVTHLDFTGPHQVLSRAPDAQVIVASMGGADVTCEGLTFTGLADLAEIEVCDILCIPGGLGSTDAMLDEAFMAQIRRLGAGAAYLTSVCTGSLILAAAGFLTGRRRPATGRGASCWNPSALSQTKAGWSGTAISSPAAG